MQEPVNEAIRMQAKRFGYFPRTFIWRGHEYNVEAVEKTWTTGSRQPTIFGGQIQRQYFQVRCPEGRFDLYQDLQHNTWRIVRAEFNEVMK